LNNRLVFGTCIPLLTWMNFRSKVVEGTGLITINFHAIWSNDSIHTVMSKWEHAVMDYCLKVRFWGFCCFWLSKFNWSYRTSPRFNFNWNCRTLSHFNLLKSYTLYLIFSLPDRKRLFDPPAHNIRRSHVRRGQTHRLKSSTFDVRHFLRYSRIYRPDFTQNWSDKE
jgi:hypothetical protein